MQGKGRRSVYLDVLELSAFPSPEPMACVGAGMLEIGLFQERNDKHLGRIPAVFHTDHINIVRIESLPLDRIDAKIYRWHAEIVSGSCLLNYRAGAGTLHRLPDALSRNPPDRDFLNLARTSDWTQLKQTIRGVQKDVDEGRFDDENPPLYKIDHQAETPQGVELLGVKPEDRPDFCANCHGP